MPSFKGRCAIIIDDVAAGKRSGTIDTLVLVPDAAMLCVIVICNISNYKNRPGTDMGAGRRVQGASPGEAPSRSNIAGLP